jgi:Zn-dependent metalloprotease
MAPALLLLLAHPAAAADWQHELAPAGPGTALERARPLLEPSLSLEPSVMWVAGAHTVRFTQTWRGLPVLGASAAVRVRPDGSVPLAVDGLQRDLTVSTSPTLDLEAASDLALGAHEELLGSRLVVLPQDRLAWELSVGSAQGPLQVLVDAHSGALLRRQSRLTHSLGRVYEQNPVATPDTSDVELTALDSSASLTGFAGGLVVENYVAGDLNDGTLESTQELGPSAGEDYLYDPPEDDSDLTDAFAQVNAFHHLAQARGFFEGGLGLDMSGEDWGLQVIVNLASDGAPYDNAFFTTTDGLGENFHQPNLIGIGQGTLTDFAVDADVFVHEFGHYASNRAIGYNEGQLHTSAYGLSPWGGSMDEGVADYFAASIFDDPVMGEASLGAFGAERDLSDDSRSCPEDIFGEVHEDGKLIGAAAWSLREVYGAELADQLVWGALSLMTADSDFQDFAEALVAVGEDMQSAGDIDEVASIEETLAASGLDACSTVQDLDQGDLTTWIWGLDLVGSSFGVDCATVAGFGSLQSFFHFSATVPDRAEALRFHVELDPQGSGDLGWQLYLREGEHVVLEPEFFLPAATEFDLESEVFTEATGVVEIPLDQLQAGQVWYGVMSSQSCPTTQATLSAEAVLPVDSGDSGADSEPAPVDSQGERTPAGCGCASGRLMGGGGLFALGLLALARRRR